MSLTYTLNITIKVFSYISSASHNDGTLEYQTAFEIRTSVEWVSSDVDNLKQWTHKNNAQPLRSIKWSFKSSKELKM